MRILLIEDDTVLGAAVRDQITADGHSADWVPRLDAASEHLRTIPYDLVLLDLMLPDGRGIPYLRALRGRGNATPVIILTALDQVSDRIEGLNAGADDYLIKPFDLAELTARIGSVARRYAGNPNPLIQHGDLEIDLAGRHTGLQRPNIVGLHVRPVASLTQDFLPQEGGGDALVPGDVADVDLLAVTDVHSRGCLVRIVLTEQARPTGDQRQHHQRATNE